MCENVVMLSQDVRQGRGGDAWHERSSSRFPVCQTLGGFEQIVLPEVWLVWHPGWVWLFLQFEVKCKCLLGQRERANDFIV